MKESFVFYKSFYDAINLLGEKAQLKLYKSIMKLNFNCCKTMTEIEQLCDEIETELKQNRHTFAQFLLIKPQILANFSKYLNGLKGADSGHLGGAPKGNTNASKNNPKTTPNENVFNEECIMNNENGAGVVCDFNFEKYFETYRENCPDLLPLNFERRSRSILEELNQFLIETNYDLEYFMGLCKRANDLKKIVDSRIDFRSMIRNHIGIMNGKYAKPVEKTETTPYLTPEETSKKMKNLTNFEASEMPESFKELGKKLRSG